MNQVCRYLVFLMMGAALIAGGQEESVSGEGRPLRDPFWPVGYLPPSMRAAETEVEEVVEEASPFNFDALTPEEQVIIRKNLKVTGLLKQGRSYFAFVNNEVVRSGDMIPLNVGSITYKFKVRSITKDTINLEPIRDKQPEKEIEPSPGE